MPDLGVRNHFRSCRRLGILWRGCRLPCGQCQSFGTRRPCGQSFVASVLRHTAAVSPVSTL